jgi:hypothetical protein
MKYELLLVPSAEAEVDRIIRYLAKSSPTGALAWCNSWEQVLAEVRSNPLRFGVAPESKVFDTDVRQALLKRVAATPIARYSRLLAVVCTSLASVDRAKTSFGEINCAVGPNAPIALLDSVFHDIGASTEGVCLAAPRVAPTCGRLCIAIELRAQGRVSVRRSSKRQSAIAIVARPVPLPAGHRPSRASRPVDPAVLLASPPFRSTL